jgi:hypothetical protein
VTAYLDCTRQSSSPFKKREAETQRTRRNILEGSVAPMIDECIFYVVANGKRTMLLTHEHVQRIINEKALTPFAQRNLLNSLRAIKWALGDGRVQMIRHWRQADDAGCAVVSARRPPAVLSGIASVPGRVERLPICDRRSVAPRA